MGNSLTISVPEAARRLGISKVRMYEIARSEGFPAFRVGERILVHEKLFEQWVQARAQKGATA